LLGPAADIALPALLGRPVRIVSVAPGSHLEAPVHLVSRQALDGAREGEHAVGECACSLEQPRANLFVDLQAVTRPVGGAGVEAHLRANEHAWVEDLVRVGGALLRVARRPNHCLGVYAEVVTAGVIQVGDIVTAVRPAKSARPSR